MLVYQQLPARLRRNADKSGAIAPVVRKIFIWFAGTLAALLYAAAVFIGWTGWNVAKALPDHRRVSKEPAQDQK